MELDEFYHEHFQHDTLNRNKINKNSYKEIQYLILFAAQTFSRLMKTNKKIRVKNAYM